MTKETPTKCILIWVAYFALLIFLLTFMVAAPAIYTNIYLSFVWTFPIATFFALWWFKFRKLKDLLSPLLIALFIAAIEVVLKWIGIIDATLWLLEHWGKVVQWIAGFGFFTTLGMSIAMLVINRNKSED